MEERKTQQSGNLFDQASTASQLTQRPFDEIEARSTERVIREQEIRLKWTRREGTNRDGIQLEEIEHRTRCVPTGCIKGRVCAESADCHKAESQEPPSALKRHAVERRALCRLQMPLQQEKK